MARLALRALSLCDEALGAESVGVFRDSLGAAGEAFAFAAADASLEVLDAVEGLEDASEVFAAGVALVVGAVASPDFASLAFASLAFDDSPSPAFFDAR